MTENYKYAQNNTDEVDLLVLLEKGLAFFNKYKKIILLGPILGIFCGVMLYYSLPKRYNSDLTVKSLILTNAEQLQIVENWNKLLSKHEYGVLAAAFQCSPTLFKQVASISAEDIQKTYSDVNPNGFVITAWVKDTSILRSLQQALINGFENLEYVKAKVSTRRQNYKELIQEVGVEIAKLDSVKSNIEKKITSPDKVGTGFIINIADVNTQMIALNEKLLDYKERLKFASGVEVVQGFTGLMQPEQPKLKWLVALGFLGGLFIALAVSFLLYLKAKLISRTINRPTVA